MNIEIWTHGGHIHKYPSFNHLKIIHQMFPVEGMVVEIDKQTVIFKVCQVSVHQDNKEVFKAEYPDFTDLPLEFQSDEEVLQFIRRNEIYGKIQAKNKG